MFIDAAVMSSSSDAVAPKLVPVVSGDNVAFDRENCVSLGKSLHEEYIHNQPFRHIAIENFLPLDVLRRVVAEFPGRKTGRFSDAHSKLKTGYQMEAIESFCITNLQNALNSSQFLEFLEALTGIRGLIPDPHFLGGGLHETAKGGHLSIHADFNAHPRLKLRRRMNLILFLNEGWKQEWGGALELWERDMSACRVKVLPEIGNAVVFNTDEDSFHGHPDPLGCPPDVYRRSIALYYYTAVENLNELRQRTTDFRARPGSKDQRTSMRLRAKELLRDCTPPILARRLRRP